MPSRIVIGVAIGSGLEGPDVALVRLSGIGLDIAPRIEKSKRVPFPAAIREVFRPSSDSQSAGLISPAELTRFIADSLVHAIRSAIIETGHSPRDVFAVGLLDPVRPPGVTPIAWTEIADRVAEQSGLTILHDFRGRDQAAGGFGQPITAVADFLAFRSDREDRLLVHLGSAASVLLIPAGAKVTQIAGFDAGPGNQLLDSMVYHGSRGREASDPGGKKAVQGCCIDALLARWLEHPFLSRKPPRIVPPDAFGRGFLLGAFDAAREQGAGLADVLCTATHLIARSIGEAGRSWLSSSTRVLLSGGGVRNGFLWQLLAQQFPDVALSRTDEAGVPALSRNAAAAGILAALTCDGVAGNAAPLTGAMSGRLLGQIIPGDGRNWARCANWIADQISEYPRANRAA
jgi:anhydro-N-acetylmuramic acid kinase